MKEWQYIGTVLTGVAALITAGVGLYEKLHTASEGIREPLTSQQKIKRIYGIVNDKDGWVNLRESPNVESFSLAKILNDTNLEIIGTSGNWYKVCTESGRTGYVYKDRLILKEYETN